MSLPQFLFSTDPERIDRDRVCAWLRESAYWALGRTDATMAAAMAASRNYGIYTPDAEQVAYGRIITDSATFAWLCDVFVDPAVRGHGVGKLLCQGILDDLRPLGLRRIMLATADAHGLYEQFGFTALPDPALIMVHNPETLPQMGYSAVNEGALK